MKKQYFTMLAALFLLVNYALAQERSINGTVTSEDDNQPLPGANLIIKGTTTGAVTDFDGKFSITIPDEKSVMIISYIAKEVTVPSGQNSISIFLKSDVNALEEVVVMGSSVSQSRKKIGNAITTLKSEDITKAPTPSVTRLFRGKFPVPRLHKILETRPVDSRFG
ncbi:carboxypeptidase-like regulatory domain-containing protein [Galbibacter pacificus]|uniref:Carboxypeptidase-like regulatory domain-containing protein n=1 Tax=Galbibacter pacificus TaxID=2996052 RepID=A0ABT6FV89_9FLAO|nr:carboxypeptidase-like regulatory domain-containing protein [Galbibacter pacificus]MDG3583899.1 carboxypeptidase-like regulatory domain-containing protein [Galbibacter pacificus]MDG3587183.1 carboxypeptidase-like regulatory domain-containing protein [Galbibacter pacificus]